VSLTTNTTFDASAHWELSAQVSLRDEEFGALAYHHVNRRLVFLKSRDLVNLVRRLGEFENAREALDALIGVHEHDRYLVALSSLAQSELLHGG
jgi:putative mycofactocin binding protein MftB